MLLYFKFREYEELQGKESIHNPTTMNMLIRVPVYIAIFL